MIKTFKIRPAQKNHLVLLAFTLLLLATACRSKNQETKDPNPPIQDGLYLGQTPPGSTPEPFAPGMVTTEGWEVSGVFTPDLNEFYFIRRDANREKQEMVTLTNKEGQWHETATVPRRGQPFFASDGKIMYLSSRYRKRTKTGEWSEMETLSSPFDTLPTMRLSVSDKKTYFFDEFRPDFTGDIWYSQLVDGKHEEPKRLSSKINNGKSFHPFIAPDESYLIFDSEREGGYGDSDIYISFRKPDSSWGEPINLGDKINTEAWEACASVTPDGKYLFFNRTVGPVPHENDNYENVDIFWVDAQVIENLKNE
ncbi:PD40 domain-containing protein [Muricauda sp. CAU 1633]|uniref:TolB family protein n=1 Tax=Allomuricauda sp. CAU 1633 TaxID=2816036 RepID=UPI001A906A46|nr:PD40 domain-containing protein [Muricauda sp. CAU 1633]MBO0322886.1 PD40 domain-containing protein [Muricauda sp. CAU 1633]